MILDILNNIIMFTKQKGMSQKELCEALGLNQQAFTGWKNGNTKSYKKYLPQIAEVLGVSVDTLLGIAPKDAYQTSSPEFSLGLSAAEPSDEAGEKTVAFHIFDTFKPDYEKLSFTGFAGDSVEIPLSLLDGRPKTDFFCLRMQDDSMFPEIHKNDIIFSEARDKTDYSGQLAVVSCGGEPAVVKKIEYDSKRSWVKLVSINPTFLSIKIEAADLEQFCVLGIPKFLIRKLDA